MRTGKEVNSAGVHGGGQQPVHPLQVGGDVVAEIRAAAAWGIASAVKKRWNQEAPHST